MEHPPRETGAWSGFDQVQGALDVKQRRQFPLPLAPTREQFAETG